ncbi:hypothetical protein HW115_17375 [Verrucomicrobiaceae bacterium N1E253]|uniref:Uncharacterized protein n=1 Tax=Oceaniferula marina TaxID=2748318 RepID=A0A851GT10_9BACT|nr:hypothetical protein [Oceaniferula marina]NWK57394.1 hypothetical protein [Oceaniferula marina]
MKEAQERLIDAVTDGWTDEEHRLMAREWFVGKTDTMDVSGLDAVAERLEQRRSRSSRLLVGVAGLVVVVCMWLIVSEGYRTVKMVQKQRFLLGGVWSDHSAARSADFGEGLSAEDQLLLFGDPLGVKASDRWVALWESDPKNPAYYVEYAMAYGTDYDRLPKDFLSVTNKIDPGNGWYEVVAAGYLSDGAVKSRPKPSGRGASGHRSKKERTEERIRKKNLKTEWDVLDQSKVDQVLALLKSASDKERFTSHQEELLLARIRLLPKAVDMVSNLHRVAYMADTPIHGFKIMRVAEVIAAEAYRCELEKDREALKALVPLWDDWVSHMNASSLFLVDSLIAKACLSVPLVNMRVAAEACDLPDVADRMHQIQEAMNDWFRIRESEENDESRDFILRKAGTLQSYSLGAVSKQAKKPRVLTNEDLKPGRMTDHSFAGRLMSVVACLLCLLLGLGVWAYRFRYGAFVREISRRMAGVLNTHDWCWILGGGVMLPWFYYGWVLFYSPCSAWNEGAGMTFYLQPAGQFVAMLLMMTFSSMVLIRWRLSKSLAFMHFTPKWVAWIPAILCVLLVPMIGMILWQWGGHSWLMLGINWGGGTVVLWLLVVLCRAIFGKKKKAIERVMVSRVFVSVFLWMSLIMLVNMWINHRQERYWFGQDWTMQMTDESNGFGGYEHQVHQQMKKEIQEVLDSTKTVEE